MSYAVGKNDYNIDTQQNLANYNSLYSLIYFDLSFRTEKVKRDPKLLIFRYKINVAPAAILNVHDHAIFCYEEMVMINQI